MKRVIRFVIGLAAFGLLALVIMPMSEHRANASGSAPVTITNTPLPVQGTVWVGNTPTVNVANMPSVNVSGTASVVNAVGQGNVPIPLVVSPQGQPYADSCYGGGQLGSCQMNTVPSGMRLVIQTVTFITNSPGQYWGGSVQTKVGGQTFDFNLVFSPPLQDQNGGNRQAVHQSTTLYADTGSAPTCVGSATDPSSAFTCTVSGFLVPAP